MFWRALFLLLLVAAASIALTYVFGAKVLLALGLILTQLKVLWAKLAAVELPAILVWLKTEARLFLRIELIKKYLMSSIMPMMLGSAIRRRIELFVARYKAAVTSRYQALMGWYGGLDPVVKILAALIVLFATLGASVSTLGLWLILFSVKLPFWLIAAGAALGRMFWASLTKTLFKTIAFLQLGWAWRLIRPRLPAAYLERKRRWDFRVARAVVRSRRLTLAQLHAQKDSLGMRLALIRAYFSQPRPKIEPEIAPEEAKSPDREA